MPAPCPASARRAASHLDAQADALCRKSLLDFVHPDEQASAENDLAGVLHSRTLHGSVTRVRFSRLSRVRRLLGYDGPLPAWHDADKIALDANYMAVDIVINLAAEGLVLCFIHAIVDLSPTDNDEHNKTGWSNWCGTPLMSPAHITQCYHNLFNSVPTAPMHRVFQILDSRDGRPLLLSWPPDHGQGTHHPNGQDFARLVENAQIGATTQDANDAKTSCTRRYKALQSMPPASQVESIFIPHGSVIFACHNLHSSPLPRSSVSSSATMQQQLPYSSYYDPPYALPPLYPPYSYPPQRWSASSSDYQQQWGSASPSPVSSAVSNLRAGSYPPPPFAPGGPQGTPLFDLPPRPASPYSNSYSPGAASDRSLPADDALVPPSRRRTSPAAQGGDGYGNVIPGGRNAGNRPNGVLKCSSCKVTTSPEWRKGPSGKKELCNACGLRYARSRAKKEGQPPSQRRRKDKPPPTVAGGGITKREASSTPPYLPCTSASAPASSSSSSMPVRLPPGTVGASGELYHHASIDDTKAGLKLTPSPSPPMGFVHYAAPGAPAHPHGHQFYSVPSPLAHTVSLRDEPSPPPQGQGAGVNDATQAGYAARPALTTMPPASFEREKDKERELPPPLALHGRRILAQQG
ncbi:hypothetical protein C0989_007456 [Termitomyces sp. Mn162]|nr:hypothetical protein C0989_007456 [Termitomyces sp. Mn162]